jgi:hypothetical protein
MRVGDLRPSLRAACPTAVAIARRNRPVVRRRAGSSSMVSVNDLRGHAASRHRQRTLCQTTTSGASP